MKALFNKISRTATAILISSVVGYSALYVQQTCCSTIVDTCIQTFNLNTDCYADGDFVANPSSQHHNFQLRSSLCSDNTLTDLSTANSCCATDRCDDYNQTTHFSLSAIQNFYLFQKNVNASDAVNDAQATFEPYSLPTSLKAVPIYIMTLSIIC